MKLLIKNGKIVNPSGVEKKDVLIDNSRIVKMAGSIEEKGCRVINAEGKYLFPGLIDLHTHLRTPGREDKETILSGSKAAVKGGFTAIQCMPNTQPAIDSYEVALTIKEEAERIGLLDIFPVGALTKGRQGKEISEYGLLKEAGCLSLSDDGVSVKDSGLLRSAMEYSSNFGMLVISHCEDKDLSLSGLIRESAVSGIWGIDGIPEIAETVVVARNIELARFLNIGIHLAHISSGRSVELIRKAKQEGVPVTAETCPHYLAFTLEDVVKNNFNANFKINPPLGTEEDRQALIKGLREGVIDCISTDHAPHTFLEKEGTLYESEFGVIGLEFVFSLTLDLVNRGTLALEDLALRMSLMPAKILGLSGRGEVKEGLRADICIADLDKEWEVTESEIASKSKNTPLLGKKLKGKIETTIYKGKVVYKSEERG